MAATNPLVSDRDVAFLLYEVLGAEALCKLPFFADHSRETFNLYLDSCRRLARDVLYPAYKPMDEQPPQFHDGRFTVHPRMKEMFPQLVGLGLLNASRPAGVAGQQLPLTVATLASAYLMAANLSAYGFIGLSAGAAHLMESFGDAWLKREFMARVYSGEWTGTMALTEPGAGSSLSDVKTKAVSNGDGTYSIRGNKIFISGADHDMAANVVNMTLARIEGAPAGIKGVSLFAIPKLRPGLNGALESNDVSTAGAIHKIGWRGLPSLVLNFGENNDCTGWLVGEPDKGITYMFQMMNEARIMIGMNGVATASVAFQESILYAQARLQGRPLAARDPKLPQIPLIEHADVKRMLLRQKAIVEGGMSLLATTALYADLAAHSGDAGERKRHAMLLDLLTPVAKTFPAEWGFEANALSVQIHGGYGYSSEYLPEAWLRDQKLNSIHEGTTGIQSLDLLGRKALAEGGAALQAFEGEILQTVAEARRAGVQAGWCDQLTEAIETIRALTLHLVQKGMQGDPEGMMRHSFHYMQLFSITAVAWQWLKQAAVAKAKLSTAPEPDWAFLSGKLHAAQYWFATELTRVPHLAALCRNGDDSYASMEPAWF